LHLGWFTSFAQNLHDVVVSQNFIVELRPRSFSELASPLVRTGWFIGSCRNLVRRQIRFPLIRSVPILTEGTEILGCN